MEESGGGGASRWCLLKPRFKEIARLKNNGADEAASAAGEEVRFLATGCGGIGSHDYDVVVCWCVSDEV